MYKLVLSDIQQICTIDEKTIGFTLNKICILKLSVFLRIIFEIDS